jgi:opacity protein-like surface antigen
MSLVKLIAAAAILTSLSSVAQAQEWQQLQGMTSAKLAASGWQQSGAAGLSWPDGRQAVISYWWMLVKGEHRFTMRCIDYFDASMSGTGGGCYQAVK